MLEKEVINVNCLISKPIKIGNLMLVCYLLIKAIKMEDIMGENHGRYGLGYMGIIGH